MQTQLNLSWFEYELTFSPLSQQEDSGQVKSSQDWSSPVETDQVILDQKLSQVGAGQIKL